MEFCPKTTIFPLLWHTHVVDLFHACTDTCNPNQTQQNEFQRISITPSIENALFIIGRNMLDWYVYTKRLTQKPEHK